MVSRVTVGIESALGTFLRGTRLDGLLRKLHGPKVPILMYHSIVPDSADRSGCLSMAGMTLSKSRFAEHMRYVAAHYRTITLSDYVGWRRNGGRLPDHPCIITCDDGFRDFFETARPVLAEHGLTAVVFVIGSTLQPGGRGSWLHDLYAIIDASPFAACSEAIASDLPDYPSGDIRTKAGLRTWARERLVNMDPSEREDLLNRLESKLGVDRHHSPRFLSESQLQQLVTEGFEIGSHSMHHELLASLDDDALGEEIAEGKRAIEAVVAREVVSFCYPFGGLGAWDDRTVRQLQANSFACAVSTVEGLNSRKTDLYTLRRIRVTGEIPLAVLVFRILGFRSFLWKLQGLRHARKGSS
jgi:peptidoglycan/xylan/chitin deacetylase (PgdA/CDA1 family)